jgi:hypothetical protein
VRGGLKGARKLVADYHSLLVVTHLESQHTTLQSLVQEDMITTHHEQEQESLHSPPVQFVGDKGAVHAILTAGRLKWHRAHRLAPSSHSSTRRRLTHMHVLVRNTGDGEKGEGGASLLSPHTQHVPLCSSLHRACATLGVPPSHSPLLSPPRRLSAAVVVRHEPKRKAVPQTLLEHTLCLKHEIEALEGSLHNQQEKRRRKKSTFTGWDDPSEYKELQPHSSRMK